MLRADRLCIYILMFGLTLLIPSIQFVTYLDECCAMLFACVAAFDCIVNRNWKKYSLLWIIIGIMTFYAIYSILFLNFNTPKYIIMDWVIEIKPYIPFCIFIAIAPVFTDKDKYIISYISTINGLIIGLALLCGHTVTEAIVFHVTYAGGILFLSSLLIIFCNIDKNGNFQRKKLYLVMLLLTLGLLCTRSKYYGIYVITLFFLFEYRPGMLRRFNISHIIILILLFTTVLAVSWSKINFYFISGNGDTFDPEVAYSFARPVLFLTGGLILLDYFPLGSGLASFATYPSQISYAGTYYEYGINTVHGLSPNMPDFICDAFFPSLAQFGFIGLILFIAFWCYDYSFLRILARNPKYRYQFIIGALIICYILIESVGGNTFTQTIGMFAMSILGTICAKGKELKVSSNEIGEKTNSEIVLKLQKI